MIQSLSKLRERRAKSESGFTLIELLVVVVILGVLIAIAVPLYLNYRKGANDSAAQSDTRNAVSVLEQCNASNAGYPTGTFTAVGAYAIPTANGCAQTINTSSGTSLTYTAAPATATYIIVATNSSGSGKYYCYNNRFGGPVTAQGGTNANLAAAVTAALAANTAGNGCP